MGERSYEKAGKNTPEVVDQIRRLRADGLSASAIGKLVGRSKSTVINIQHQNGMQVPRPGFQEIPLTTEESTRILELRRLGWSYKEIGKAVGRSQDRVGRVCLAAGLGKDAVLQGDRVDRGFQVDRKVVRSERQQLAKGLMLQRMGAVWKDAEPLPPPDTTLEPLAVPAPRPCQYIADDGAPWRICGRPVVARLDGSPGSWCARHRRVCVRVVHDIRVPWLPQHVTGHALAEELPPS